MSFLHIRVVEAVGLPPTDLNGFADPFCRIHLENVTELSHNEHYKTKTKNKSTDPIWNESFSFQVSDKDFEAGQLIVDLYDHDITSKNDELGRAILKLEYFQSNSFFKGWLPIQPKSKRNHDQLLKARYVNYDKSTKLDIQNDKMNDNSNKLKIESSTTDIIHSMDTMVLSDDEYDDSDDNFINRFEQSSELEEKKQEHATAFENHSNINDALVINSPIKLKTTTSDPKLLQKKFANNSALSAVSTYDVANMNDIGSNLSHRHKSQLNKNYGNRRIDTSRIYLVICYEKFQYFGTMKEKDLQDRAIAKLKLTYDHDTFNKLYLSKNSNTKPSSLLNLFISTFNAGEPKNREEAQNLVNWIPRDNNIDMYVLGYQELKIKDKDIIDESNNNHDEQNKNLTIKDQSIEVQENEQFVRTPSPGPSETDNHNSIDVINEHEEKINFHQHQHHLHLKKKLKSSQQLIKRLIKEHLGHEYTAIGHHHMWEIRLFVFIKKHHLYKISGVTIDHEATGKGNILGNKGGVVLSFDFDGTSMCFVCSHLAAHQGKQYVEQRNNDYRKICTKIKVGWPKQQLLGQFHHIFWLGDLNYRCNHKCDVNTVGKEPKQETVDSFITQLENNNIKQLLLDDELLLLKKDNTIFQDFKENDITFLPTFKVQPKVQNHTYNYTRAPSWCDRILNKSAPGFYIHNTDYNCYSVVSCSDHKPVYSKYELEYWERSCGIDDDVIKCEIHLRNVYGKNFIAADISGKSDPFIHWPRQQLLEKYIQSKRINRNLNPTWKDKHFKPITLQRNSLPYLLNALLLFQIRDYDRFSEDDIIGYGYLSLRSVVLNIDNWCPFHVNLTFDGENAGSLSGEYKLVYEKVNLQK